MAKTKLKKAPKPGLVQSGKKTANKTTRSTPSALVVARIIDGSKIYGEGESQVVALNKVSLDFRAGQFVAIMGPSGSGKSTLLHCLATLDSLTSGQVELGGQDISNVTDFGLTNLRRLNIGFIFQAYNLIPTLNAIDNITLPLIIAKKPVDKRWLDRLIDVLALESRLRHRPNQLSGGQQQRVAIARALITRPKIIFADEPTGNLDSVNTRQILEFFRFACQEFNQALAVVTHDSKVASYAQRVVFLQDGQIVNELHNATSEQVLSQLEKLGG